jgi:hypothetical protein
MYEDCFIWAAKVRFWDNENFNHLVVLPNGEFPWDEEHEICLYTPGTGTPGYWKNHPDSWPVMDEVDGVNGIIIGGVWYSQSDAIEYMKHPTAGDKIYNMFEQLVAAMLNVAIGNDDSCINDITGDPTENDFIDEANNWMSIHPVGSSAVDASSDAWQMAEGSNFNSASYIHYMLDEYNNGNLDCADHRD